MHKKIIYIIIAVFGTLLIGCSSAQDKLDEEIKKALGRDNEITEPEWQCLQSFIAENSADLAEANIDFTNGDAFRKYIEELAANRRGDFPGFQIWKEDISSDKSSPDFNVYLENSGSMDGYVKGNTSFEAAITNLLVKAKHHYGKEHINLNFVNTAIHPINKEIENFAIDLEPNTIKVGNTASSNLNQIFKLILQNTDSSDISMFISDCIYSIKGQDTKGLLNYEKSLTMDAFLTQLKKFDFSTLVVKLESEFSGSYWDKNNQSKQIQCNRPYYFWFMGKKELIAELRTKITLAEIEGYQDFFLLENSDLSSPFYYTACLTTDKIGNFKPDRDNSSKDFTHGITEMELCDRGLDKGKFQMAVAADMVQISTGESYLKDPSNFIMSSGIELVEVKSISEGMIAQSDKNKVSDKATHLFLIRTSQLLQAERIELELKKKIPAWVNNSTTEDDSDILSVIDKTFGISYLIEGLDEAYRTYNPENTSYFKIAISIKK